jgi:AcrR family transcriptional regulator
LQVTARTENAPVGAAPRLRADARRNREALLAAAEAVFSERGATASMDDIARRAGVGIGTLYRHFPTREALLAAACDERLLALAERGEALAASAAPAQAFATFLDALVQHACTYRGLAASFGVVLQSDAPGCHATTEACRRLLHRAQAAHELRRDVEFDDVVCVVAAISLAAQAGSRDARRTRRLLALFVDGLRAPAAPAPPSPKARRRRAR